MNHLIVYAHPNTNSFSNAVANAVKQFSIEQEYKTELRDLYSIGFDPVLKLPELQDIQSGNIPEDIKKEQNYIEWADIITFIYPLWWTGMPAMLKGYIDRVFSYGMAYSGGKNGKKGLLKDKKVFIFTPMGTAEDDYNSNGMLDALKQTCDTGIFTFCGMKVEQHIFLGEVSTTEEETRKQYLQSVVELLSKTLNCGVNQGNNDKSNKSNGNEVNNKNKESKGEVKSSSNNKESNKENSSQGNDGKGSQNNNQGSNSKDKQNNNQASNNANGQNNSEGSNNKNNENIKQESNNNSQVNSKNNKSNNSGNSGSS